MRKSGGWFYVFLTCLLSVPTGAYLLPGLVCEKPESALLAGAMLGAEHMILRPILRFLSAPLGCLTLGLAGLVIDVGLIYLADSLVPGFTVTSFTHAILLALFINTICAIVGGRSR